MMTSSALLKQTFANIIPPKTPAMKSVFSGNIKSNNYSNNKNTTKSNKMVKVHKKTREELKAMKVVDLKAMVKRHNLHNQIKGYTTMKKENLIESLMLYSRVMYNPSKAPKKGKQAPVAQTPEEKPKRGRPKKRIAPTLISDEVGKSPMKSKGKGSSSFSDAVSNIEKKANKMDKSKKGKKLVSNSPVKKSREPKTKNNYRTGRNFV